MLIAMPGVKATDATREINIAISVHVFDPCVLRVGDVNRSGVRESARNGGIAPGGKLA
jgi:hypothetical protein